MTLKGTNGSTCRDVRQLLGVYVVGAIEPSERSVVDGHLGDCQHCRDELAGLAGLPAMLSRVPVGDVERMNDAELPPDVEPSSQLLDSLLSRVGARRKKRLWRGAVAVAAAAAIAAGGATTAVELARPAVPVAALAESVHGVDPNTGVGAVVDYSGTQWGGTAMRVQVSGIKPGTTCVFYAVGTDGAAYAGSWTVQGSYGQSHWYATGSDVSKDSIHSFVLEDLSGKKLVSIPVS